MGKLAENVTSAAWWHPAVRYKGPDVFGTTEAYNRAFEAKYKTVPDYVEASASACGVILQLAIEKAGSVDPKAVRDALAAMDVTTFYGPVKFGPTGQIVSLKPPVFQLRDGKPVVIYPDEIRQGEFRTGVK
jgi:branched-chain amino acid transport system substrate-binding protein